jgi:hypothetical protein
MEFFGNIFTHYHYTTTDITTSLNDSIFTVKSKKSGLNIVINSIGTVLPPFSPFINWKEARRFAGPLPFTFTYTPLTKEVLIIEGVRENWTPEPVEVITADIDFIKKMKLKEIVLANAFMIQNIPYYWKKGKIDVWKGQ